MALQINKAPPVRIVKTEIDTLSDCDVGMKALKDGPKSAGGGGGESSGGLTSS